MWWKKKKGMTKSWSYQTATNSWGCTCICMVNSFQTEMKVTSVWGVVNAASCRTELVLLLTHGWWRTCLSLVSSFHWDSSRMNKAYCKTFVKQNTCVGTRTQKIKHTHRLRRHFIVLKCTHPQIQRQTAVECDPQRDLRVSSSPSSSSSSPDRGSGDDVLQRWLRGFSTFSAPVSPPAEKGKAATEYSQLNTSQHRNTTIWTHETKTCSEDEAEPVRW